MTFSIHVIVTHSIDMSQKVTNALKCLVTARAGESTSNMLLKSGDMGGTSRIQDGYNSAKTKHFIME